MTNSLARRILIIYLPEGALQVQHLFPYLNYPDFNIQDFRMHISIVEDLETPWRRYTKRSLQWPDLKSVWVLGVSCPGVIF